MKRAKTLPSLLARGDEDQTKQQLLHTGLEKGMVAVDMSGISFSSIKLMSEIVGPSGQIIVVDPSKENLQAAEDNLKKLKNVVYHVSSFDKIDLGRELADYVFSRFVFSHLLEPREVFDELVRITKQGGKIVVGDLDHQSLNHYPLPSHLEFQLKSIMENLANNKLIDPYIGRKLFSFFQESQVRNIRVHLYAHNLVYGESNPKDILDWTERIRALEELKKQGHLNLDFDLDVFKTEFFAFFENPSRFSYSPLILVEGVK